MTDLAIDSGPYYSENSDFYFVDCWGDDEGDASGV